MKYDSTEDTEDYFEDEDIEPEYYTCMVCGKDQATSVGMECSFCSGPLYPVY